MNYLKNHKNEISNSDYKALAEDAYSGKSAPGYTLLEQSPTIKIYKKNNDEKIVISARGTADWKDVKADLALPFNNLKNTKRYKEDEDFVKKSLKKYTDKKIYITGHSLGGAVAQQLAKDNKEIIGGESFNPAFQASDIFTRNVPSVKRNYTSTDPLGLLGRHLPGSKVSTVKKSMLSYLLPNTGIFGVAKSLHGHKISSFSK